MRRPARPRLCSLRPPRTLGARTSPSSRARAAASGARVPAPEGSPRRPGAPRPVRRASTQARLAATAPSGHLSARLPAPALARGSPGGEAPVPARDCLLPRELGAGPRADTTGRGPRWPRPCREGGAAGAAAPPPAGAARERWELGLQHWRADGPSSPGAGRGGDRGRRDSGRGEGARSRPRRAGCAGARRCRAEVAPGWKPRGGGVRRRDSGFCPRRPGGATRGPRRGPEPSVPHEEGKNAVPGRGVGHLGTRATTAGKLWGGPWLRAPGCLGSPRSQEAERRDLEKQLGARQPGVLPRGPAGEAGAFCACGWSPTTKAIPRDPNYRVREAIQGLII